MFYQRCVKAFLLLLIIIVLSIVRFFFYDEILLKSSKSFYPPPSLAPPHILAQFHFSFLFFSPDDPLTHPDGGEHGGLTEGARRHGD